MIYNPKHLPNILLHNLIIMHDSAPESSLAVHIASRINNGEPVLIGKHVKMIPATCDKLRDEIDRAMHLNHPLKNDLISAIESWEAVAPFNF